MSIGLVNRRSRFKTQPWYSRFFRLTRFGHSQLHQLLIKETYHIFRLFKTFSKERSGSRELDPVDIPDERRFRAVRLKLEYRTSFRSENDQTESGVLGTNDVVVCEFLDKFQRASKAAMGVVFGTSRAIDDKRDVHSTLAYGWHQHCSEHNEKVY